MGFLQAPRRRTPRTLSTQTHVYEDVHWNYITHTESPSNRTIPFADIGAGTVSTDPPYWEFTTHLNSAYGLRLESVVARDTQSSGSTETVFEKIEFVDLHVKIGGNWIPFNVSRAFGHGDSQFRAANGGTLRIGTTPDTLYHSGVLLRLVDNVLSQDGGLCMVKVELSVVFRGARGDFDPGGIPKAMLAFPQISYTWENGEGTTARVEAFRGSVKITINNKMYHMHGQPAPPNANSASLFTDSNNNRDGRKRLLRADGGIMRENTEAVLELMFRNTLSIPSYPFGWAMIFDYVKLDIKQDTEVVGVYGPNDGPKYSTVRREDYPWPNTRMGPRVFAISLTKVPRQGMYDNIHIHAKMRMNDIRGNEQVHAPFCGHSCVHLHWRWSSISDRGAPAGWGWKYKGWGARQAHAVSNRPLIPPNQKLKVAITHPGTTRNSEDHIINPTSPTSWEGSSGADGNLRKSIWYSVDIDSPRAGEKQVIMEHGIGWAYAYEWNSAVDGLTDAIEDDLPWTGVPSQMQLAQFFSHDVYPVFRYFNHHGTYINQVPNGDNTYGLSTSLPVTSMEDL